MDIQSQTISIIQDRGPIRPNILLDLRVGRQLQAKVIRLLPQNLAQLSFNGSLIRAQTPGNLTVGENLLLEVVKSKPIPSLKIVSEAKYQESIERALRQLLPKQQSLNNFQSSLLKLTQNGANLPILPPSIYPLIHGLLKGLPQLKDIARSELIKQAFLKSGLFLENNLLNSNADGHFSASSDTKAKLLQLRFVLNNIPSSPQRGTSATEIGRLQGDRGTPTTFSDPMSFPSLQSAPRNFSPEPSDKPALKSLQVASEGALAKIVVDQINSLPDAKSESQSWRFELPFLNSHTLESVGVRIIREETTQKSLDSPAKWSVELTLNPPGMHAIYCKIVLADDHIDTFFWSENHRTAERLKCQLNSLKDNFQSAGLNSRYIESRCGHQPVEPPIKMTDGLVNEKA